MSNIRFTFLLKTFMLSNTKINYFNGLLKLMDQSWAIKLFNYIFMFKEPLDHWCIEKLEIIYSAWLINL